MKATKAYIAGVGTTGLLVASSLLMLTVMSALVAFRGFPGADAQGPVQSILVQTKRAPAPVSVPALDSAAVKALLRGSKATERRRAAGGVGGRKRSGIGRPGSGSLARPVTTGRQPVLGGGDPTDSVPTDGVPTPSTPTPGLPSAPSLPQIALPPPPDVVPPPGGSVGGSVGVTTGQAVDTVSGLLGH